MRTNLLFENTPFRKPPIRFSRTPGWTPKIRKKYPQEIQRLSLLGPFLYFFGIVFVFSGPNPGWGQFVFFVRSFLNNFGIQGFLWSLSTRPAGSQCKARKGNKEKADASSGSRLVGRSNSLTAFWGSPKPIHLKPGHLKMAFFAARCRLDGAFLV